MKLLCQTWIHAGHREVESTRRRVRAGAGAFARAHRSAQQMAASRTHRLCIGIAAVQGGLFEFQALVVEARYMKIYLHSYQTQVTIITPCGHAKFKDTTH